MVILCLGFIVITEISWKYEHNSLSGGHIFVLTQNQIMEMME